MVLCSHAFVLVSRFKCIACRDDIDQAQINCQSDRVMALIYPVFESDDSHVSLKAQRPYDDMTKKKVVDNTYKAGHKDKKNGVRSSG